jgi:hypothetical protein
MLKMAFLKKVCIAIFPNCMITHPIHKAVGTFPNVITLGNLHSLADRGCICWCDRTVIEKEQGK